MIVVIQGLVVLFAGDQVGARAWGLFARITVLSGLRGGRGWGMAALVAAGRGCGLP